MTFAAIFEAQDGLVTLSDGWTSSESASATYSAQKTVWKSMSDRTVVWLMAGRSSFGNVPVAEVIQAMDTEHLEVPGTSLSAWARATIVHLGMASDRHPETATGCPLELLVGGLHQDRADWFWLELPVDGRSVVMSPREDLATSGYASIGRAESWTGHLLGDVDPMSTTAEALARLLRDGVMTYWQKRPAQFTEDCAGGTWQQVIATPSVLETQSFQAGPQS